MIVQSKITVWCQTKYPDNINKEQLLDIIKDNESEGYITNNEDLFLEGCENMILHDTEEWLESKKNEGDSTLVIYEDNLQDIIWKNGN